MAGAEAPVLKIYREVIFDSNLTETGEIPKFLNRAQSEEYSDYFKRIDQFLSQYNRKDLNKILGLIDPSVEKYKPTMDYMIVKINSKKSSCNLI